MNKSFFNFTPRNNLDDRLTSLEYKLGNMQLMYRPPNSSEHVNITKALDKIYENIGVLENRLKALEDIHFDSGK